MTAARLRQAADLLRERAEAATPGPWAVTSTTAGLTGILSTTGLAPSVYTTNLGAMRSDDMRFVATMHPGVALAVADMVDGWADDIVRYGGHHGSDDRALAVADAVLGGAR